MNKIKILLIAINLVAVLGYFGFSIAEKERLLSEGVEVRLQLAPVDPRSLMQGDYMTLRYAVTTQCEADSDRYIVVTVPDGEFVRTQMDNQNLKEDEVALRVVHRNGGFHLSSESFFFQEGTSRLYNDAKYALVVVEPDGDIFIKYLCDEAGVNIVPSDVKVIEE